MEKSGEQFLHKKDSRLHVSGPVEREKSRKERAGEKVSQKPAEKIYDWLKVIEKTHLGHRDDPRVAERIKDYYHKEYVIDPEDIPESYFDNQRRLAREQGHGDIEVTDAMRNQLTEVIVNDQESTLDNWIEYFTSPDSDGYPMWAKYWAFNSMIKLSSYDKEKHAFAKRDKGTVAPFPDLNREALAYVVDAIVKKAHKEKIQVAEDNPELKKLIDAASFGKLYAYAIEKVTPTEENELLNTKGEWKKYSQNSDHMPLVESLQGHGTGWCTAGESTAQAQLKNGDFHVFYSYDKNGQPTVPRVAIRMEGDNIAEVRGIAPDQNLDPYIGEVVSKKLAQFPDGKAYEKKSADMKRLTEIENRHAKGEELTKDDIRFLYEFDSKIEGFGYERDPRIDEIVRNRDAKADLSLLTGYAKEQIRVGRRRGGESLDMSKVMFYYGDLDFAAYELAHDIKFPKIVSGSVKLDNLRSARDMELPESIGGDLYLQNLSSAKGLKLPKSIGRHLYMTRLTSAEGLEFPESIGGSLLLERLSSAEGLELPKKIGKTINLDSITSAEGLEFPESIGGSLFLRSLTSAKGLKLPEIAGGSLFVRDLESFEDLELPEIFNGDLQLGWVVSVEGIKFPRIINGELNLAQLGSAEGLKLPEQVSGDLNLASITSAEGLVFPLTVGGNIDLCSLRSIKGLVLPEVVGGEVIVADIHGENLKKLRDAYPKLEIYHKYV